MHNLFLVYFINLYNVSGISRPIIRSYNRIYTAFGTYYSFRWLSVVLQSKTVHTASGICHTGSVAACWQAATEPVYVMMLYVQSQIAGQETVI